jgi:hypothetical protein
MSAGDESSRIGVVYKSDPPAGRVIALISRREAGSPLPDVVDGRRGY